MMVSRVILCAAAGIASGLATTVTAREPLPVSAYAALNDAIVEEQIAPAHAEFASATDALAAAMGAFCAEPDSGSLEEVRAAYHAAYDGWMSIAWVDFGPQVLFMRPMRVHFWPDSRNTLGRQLSGVLSAPREDLLEPEALADASVALQGLPALERLLFEVTPIADNAYACELATAVAGNVRAIASDLAAGWADPEMLPDTAAVTSNMYQAVYAHLDLILTRKIGPAVGKSADEARPRLAENWRSQRAMRNVAANLTAVLAIVENGQSIGFADVLRDTAGEPDLAADLVGSLEDALAIARSLAGRPMAELVVEGEGRDALMEMATAIDVARELWARDVGEAMILSIGFNSLDGD